MNYSMPETIQNIFFLSERIKNSTMLKLSKTYFAYQYIKKHETARISSNYH